MCTRLKEFTFKYEEKCHDPNKSNVQKYIPYSKH